MKTQNKIDHAFTVGQIVRYSYQHDGVTFTHSFKVTARRGDLVTFQPEEFAGEQCMGVGGWVPFTRDASDRPAISLQVSTDRDEDDDISSEFVMIDGEYVFARY